MELKTIVAIFDLFEHTGAVEDRLITEHIATLKRAGFRSCSNTLIKISKENLYNHETDMFKQIIVMVRPEQPGERHCQPIYTMN